MSFTARAQEFGELPRTVCPRDWMEIGSANENTTALPVTLQFKEQFVKFAGTGNPVSTGPSRLSSSGCQFYVTSLLRSLFGESDATTIR